MYFVVAASVKLLTTARYNDSLSSVHTKLVNKTSVVSLFYFVAAIIHPYQDMQKKSALNLSRALLRQSSFSGMQKLLQQI